MTIHKIGIIGAGSMGAGIAQAASFWGKRVTLLDTDQRNLNAAMDRIGGIYQGRVDEGELSAEQMTSRLNLITPTLDWEGLADVDFVIEAVPEDIDLKASVLQKAIQFCPADAILASHNATLSIGELGQKISRPEMLVGIHFNYPSHEMVLVEIAHCGLTDRRIIDQVAVFAESMDKVSVVVQDGVGYLQNRQLLPYLIEATLALQEGQKTLQEIDAAMIALGMYMGPFKQIDLVGIDVCIALAQRMGYQSDGLLPKLWTDLEKAGCLGVKTGSGFYDYKSGEASVNPLVAEYNEQRPSQGNEFAPNRLLLPMINEAARILEQGAADAYDIDLAMKIGTGMRIKKKFSGALEGADSFGLPVVVSEMEQWQKRYGDRFKPAGIFNRLIARGRTGREAHAGFFEYAPSSVQTTSTRAAAWAGIQGGREFQTIQIVVRDSIAVLAIENSLANKINTQVLQELAEAVDVLNANENVKAVVLMGVGNFAFSIGMHGEMLKAAMQNEQAAEEMVGLGRETLRKIEASTKPYIAAINGTCFGAGLELAVACHFRVASKSIRLGYKEISMGNVPVWGTAGRLQRIIGRSRATRMILSGQNASAPAAAEWGLIDEVAPDGYVLDKAISLAKEMTGKSAVALKAAMSSLDAAMGPDHSHAGQTEIAQFKRVLASNDIREGMTALREERPAFFQDN